MTRNFSISEPLCRALEIGTYHEENMILPKGLITVIGVLIAISLASTVTALALQSYFGRLPSLALLGPVLAAIGAAIFAIVLFKRPSK